MASSNLDLVRSIYAAWERGDYDSAEWADPEIEFVIADGPSPGRWSGLAGMAQGWRTWLGAWEGFHQEADDHRIVDDERVLVFFRPTGRGKTSGLDLAQMHATAAGLFHVRDGKVTKFVVYLDHERALADLGLVSEEARDAR
jgi:ketosteroid isomerase-like protein